MKKLIYAGIIGAAMLTSITGYSQTVVFANNAQTLVINSLTGLPAATGVLRVGLYYSADLTAIPDRENPDDSFSQAGASAAVGGLLGAGRFSGGNRDIPELDAASGMALVQVRAWSAEYASYDEAFTAGLGGQTALVGQSNPFLITPTVSPAPPAPITAAGLQSFAVTIVPEPSMIALSILGGLGAMALLRRRK